MTTNFDYAGAIVDADALIQFFGMNAVLRRMTDTPTDRPCRVVIVDFLPRDARTDLTNPTDRRVIISAANPEVQAEPPDAEHDLLVTFVQPAGTVEDVVLPFTSPVKPTAPAGVTVMYEATVRR